MTASQGCSVDGPQRATGSDLNRHWTSTPCSPPWEQHLGDRMKCCGWGSSRPPSEACTAENDGEVVYVADMAACQALAVANGHPFYAFRHEEEDDGFRCITSATCD